MSDDIVARLRGAEWYCHKSEEHMEFCDKKCASRKLPNPDECRAAADEIERLRGIINHYDAVRQDYCSKWVRWISDSDGAELTRWLRSYATEMAPPDFDGDDVKTIHAAIDTRILQAAAEIERLRGELATRCGDHGPGAHTAGPVEHFIPEAL